MAGLDGIQNKIHPGEAMDKNLYDLPPAELADVPTVCGSLREALEALEADHEFLLKGDVFTKDQIDAYCELKWDEVLRVETTPRKKVSTAPLRARRWPATSWRTRSARKNAQRGTSTSPACPPWWWRTSS
jgi:hypothetical protein